MKYMHVVRHENIFDSSVYTYSVFFLLTQLTHVTKNITARSINVLLVNMNCRGIPKQKQNQNRLENMFHAKLFTRLKIELV